MADRFAFVFGIASVIVLLMIVQALSHYEIIDPYTVPSPLDAFGAISRIIAEEGAVQRMLETAREVVVAGLFTILIGVALGTLLFVASSVRHALQDWVAAFAGAPLVLAFPLFLVLFGRTPATVIVMSVITGLVPMALKTLEGLSGTRGVLNNVGLSLGMSRPQIFRKILVPAALPVLFTGVRLSWTFVLISVVGIEFLINLDGLGELINELAERYDLAGTYAAILLTILVSVVFFIVLERLEQWLQPQR